MSRMVECAKAYALELAVRTLDWRTEGHSVEPNPVESECRGPKLYMCSALGISDIMIQQIPAGVDELDQLSGF